MKLWKISQSVNDGYDIYDSAIVAAETEEEARLIHPQAARSFKDRTGKERIIQAPTWNVNDWKNDFGGYDHTWAAPSYVSVEYIGEAKAGTVAGSVLASFNAG